MRIAAVLAASVATGMFTVAFAADTSFADKRRELVAELASLSAPTPAGRLDSRVLEAMGRVPRHEFVPPALAPRAYENRPLPIGNEQTISQPYVVALMTDLLRVRKGDRVLEVGTGSGYQAAVLAEMGAGVHSIEIVEALATSARARLGRLGYGRVEVIAGDGYRGLPARAPFDSIVVTAAPDHVPPALVEQLKRGGRMVIPVGPAFRVQELLVIEKDDRGRVQQRSVAAVRFVPLTGDR